MAMSTTAWRPRRLSADDLAFAQQHVRILSGLYGILKPLDLMQPYRLEMGTRFANPAGKDLYAFWGETLLDAINAELEAGPRPVVVNLGLRGILQGGGRPQDPGHGDPPVFEDWKSGKYKIISFYAKRARGLMTRYAVLTPPDRARGAAGLRLRRLRLRAGGFRRDDPGVPPARGLTGRSAAG